MEKKLLLLCFSFMLCIGVNANEVLVLPMTEDADQIDIFDPTIEPDFVYYMTGRSITVPLKSDHEVVMSATYMTATVKLTSVTYTFDEREWVACGSPAIFHSGIISGGVLYMVRIYITW